MKYFQTTFAKSSSTLTFLLKCSSKKCFGKRYLCMTSYTVIVTPLTHAHLNWQFLSASCVYKTPSHFHHCFLLFHVHHGLPQCLGSRLTTNEEKKYNKKITITKNNCCTKLVVFIWKFSSSTQQSYFWIFSALKYWAPLHTYSSGPQLQNKPHNFIKNS